MRPALLAALTGIITGVVFDYLWVNLFVAGIGAFLFGVFWMPLLGVALAVSRSMRAHWILIVCFAVVYAPTQFITRAFLHEPSTRWPMNEMLVVLWCNFWFAVTLSAIGIAVWSRWRTRQQFTAAGRRGDA